MRRFPFAFILFLVLLCSPCLARTVSDDATFEVPFLFEKGHVIVQAKIKKDIPVEVVIATGAEYSTVDSALTKKYKLQNGYALDRPITGRDDRIYFFGSVPDVHVGDTKPTDFNMRVVSLSETSRIVGREIFAVLGADFFKGRVIQLDFRKKILRLLSESAADALRNRKSASALTDSATLRMIANDDPFIKTTLPLTDGVAFDGKNANVVLDTGAFVAVGLSSSTANKLGFTVPADNAPPRQGEIRSVRLGGIELADVSVVISAKGTNLDRDLAPHGAVIGIGVLQNFVVTFDFRKKFIVLER